MAALTVEEGSNVYTDTAILYEGSMKNYVREMVNHSAREYVRGDVHTNGVENFWSLLKRSIKGTYVSVDPFHLFRYVDEQVFPLQRTRRQRPWALPQRRIAHRRQAPHLQHSHRSGDDTRENVTNKPNRTSDEDRENEKANVPLTTGHHCRKWLT